MPINQPLNQQMDTWISAHEEEIVEAVKQLIAIRSVGTPYDPQSPFPFGEDCAKAVDAAQMIIERAGLQAKNYDYYGISAIYPGRTDKSIGFFSHLDIVPEGENWTFDPFSPFVKDGYIFGRGSLDNKLAVVTVIYTLKFLKDHDIKFKHTLFAFLGSNEESGMLDVEYYLQAEVKPSYCLVSDSRFPLCIGEKGIMTIDLSHELHDGNLVELHAGHAPNMVPGYASAVIRGRNYDEVVSRLGNGFTVEAVPQGVKISTEGRVGHAAFPENTINALPKLATALLEYQLLEGTAIETATFINDAFSSHYGEGLNIDFADELSGRTTHVAVLGRTLENRLTIKVNIRYAISAVSTLIVERVQQVAEAFHYQLDQVTDNPSYSVPPDDPVVQELLNMTNEILGTNLDPYVMGGGTHARKLPNAIGFGPNRGDIPSPFQMGRGGGHQADEAARLQNIWDGIKVYVHALLTLDEMLD